MPSIRLWSNTTKNHASGQRTTHLWIPRKSQRVHTHPPQIQESPVHLGKDDRVSSATAIIPGTHRPTCTDGPTTRKRIGPLTVVTEDMTDVEIDRVLDNARKVNKELQIRDTIEKVIQIDSKHSYGLRERRKQFRHENS